MCPSRTISGKNVSLTLNNLASQRANPLDNYVNAFQVDHLHRPASLEMVESGDPPVEQAQNAVAS